jgi:ribosomal protein S18 acetylase RimI-like enzyme
VRESVVGYAMYSRVFEASTGDRRLFLGDLVVARTVRSKGVGRALMQQVITEAERLGCGRVTWEVWKGNQTALNFYSYLPTEVDEVDVSVLKRRQFQRAIRSLRSL